MTPVDVFFFLLQGKGEIEIGDEKEQITKDTIVHSPINIVQSWHNKSNRPVRIIIAKALKLKESKMLL